MVTGVKDASDKKILVDMLLWAVDNPAPANYFLISGDRDFSNALHQLRLRKYNILLAQPPKASAPLVAAAKCVWLWTSLLSGGAPLSSGELSYLASGNHVSNSERVPNLVTEPNHISQPLALNSQNRDMSSQNTCSTGSLGDLEHKFKYVLKTNNKPNLSTSSSSLPVTESAVKNKVKFVVKSNNKPNLSTSSSGSPFTEPEGENNDSIKVAQSLVKLPHEFFPVVPNSRLSHNLLNNQDSSENKQGNSNEIPQDLRYNPLSSNNLQTQPMSGLNLPFPNSLTGTFQPGPPYSDGFKFSAAPIPKPHNSSKFRKFKSTRDSKHVLSTSITGNPDTSSKNVILEVQGSPPTSEYEQGLVGVILLALDTLKNEKVMPTEGNIIDCITYGDSKYRTADVRKALDCAIKLNAVKKPRLGALEFYIGRCEKLWHCVNILGGNVDQYPKTTWDRIQKFLASLPGRSAILSSQCR